MNTLYKRKLLTEDSTRRALKAMTEKKPNWYAPIDFGQGLTVGGFWSIDSGTGRWEYLNGKVVAPLIIGKRVLDLGSNNGIMPLMMLRAGAQEVVGVELSPDFIEAARLVHRIFEWRDMRTYKFTIHNCNMTEVLHRDWGTFDVVTAFCSLYYLSEEDMAKVVRRASEFVPVMILQANTATRQEAQDEKSKKSSLEFMRNLLIQNGFPDLEVFAPKNYGRPLLIGRRR